MSDPEILEKHIQWFVQADRKHWPKTDAEHRRMVEELRREPERVREMVQKVSADIGQDIDRQYGVSCLTTKPDSGLMWSHYAAKHKGICVEFGTNNEVVCAALKVQYCDEYPYLDLSDDGLEQSLMPLISKSSEWAYEDEYRLIAQERNAAFGDETLMMDEHMLKLPLRSIKSVIVGCSMPDVERKEVNAIITELGGAVDIKQASRQSGFGIGIAL